jgi:DNA polymerase I-like protein with 3'-5' exonuclease and polymerase domains
MVYKNETPTTPFGRERHFVITNEGINHIQNECVNFPVQSVASDFTMFALIEITEWIEAEGLQDDVYIVINVHDSIILEVRDDTELIAKVARAGQKIMSEVPKKYLPDMNVPFRADVEVGHSWGKLEKWHED